MTDGKVNTLGLLRTSARAHPRSALAAFGLVLSLLSLTLTLNNLRGLGNPMGTLLRNAGYGFWTLLVLMLVTYTVRTFRFQDILRGWLYGFFPAIGLVVILVKFTEPISDSGNWRTAFMVPIIEEVTKALALVLLLVMVFFRKGREPSITDLGIFGYAIGAGFELHEDGLWVRDISSGFDSSFWGAFFPTFLSNEPFVVTHAGWTGLAGLGLGFGWHYRRRPIGIVLAVVPLGITILDHISINYRGDAADRLRWMVADGKLSAWLLVAGFVIAVFVDRGALKQTDASHGDRDRIAPLLKKVRSFPNKKLGAVLSLLLIGEYRAANGRCYRRARNGSAPVSAPALQQPPASSTF